MSGTGGAALTPSTHIGVVEDALDRVEPKLRLYTAAHQPVERSSDAQAVADSKACHAWPELLVRQCNHNGHCKHHNGSKALQTQPQPPRCSDDGKPAHEHVYVCERQVR